MKRIFLFVAFLLAAWQSKAQSADTGYIYRPFHVAFITPLSTNGMQSGRAVNNFSLNIIAGYNAGLQGVEIGSLANVEKDFIEGAQIAGFGNIVGGPVKGTQIAGFMNLGAGTGKGLQIGGFTNILADSAQAVQISGFGNLVGGSNLGIQIGGFGNVATGWVKGSQIAGFGNIATGDVKGAQIAGAINIATRDITGVQISGLLNLARKVKGSQIGVFNIADSVTGVPIGFLSLVRHGYHAVEVTASEASYASVLLRLGVHPFHNIFGVGLQPLDGEMYWRFGYGIGTETNWDGHSNIGLDAVAWQYRPIQGGNNDWDLNLLNTLRLNYIFGISDRFRAFAGPSFNVYVMNESGIATPIEPLPIAPYTIYDSVDYDTRLQMWIGGQAGVRVMF